MIAYDNPFPTGNSIWHCEPFSFTMSLPAMSLDAENDLMKSRKAVIGKGCQNCCPDC